MQKIMISVILMFFFAGLSGCLSGDSDNQTEVEDIDYNHVYIMSIGLNENYSMGLDGETLKLESARAKIRDSEGGSNSPTYWRTVQTLYLEMQCEDGQITSMSVDVGQYLPNLANEECTIHFESNSYHTEISAHFTYHTLYDIGEINQS